MPMHLLHSLHIHRITQLKEELDEIYINLMLRSFALSLTGVFVPVFLLKLSFPLIDVFKYLIALYLSWALMSPLTARISSKFGVKHTIAMSIPLLVSYFVILYFLDSILSAYKFAIYLIGMLLGAQAAMYWLPLNVDFAKNSDKLHRESEVSFMILASQISGFIAPVLGGLIITNFSFNAVFMIAIILLLVSVFPLLYTKDFRGSVNYEWSHLIKSNTSFFDSFVLQGSVEAVSLAILPIYIYYITNSIVSLGGIISAGLLGSFLLVLLMGKISKKIDKRMLMIAGIILYALSCLMFVFANSWVWLCISFILFDCGIVLIDIPFFSRFCDGLNNSNRSEKMVMREIGLKTGAAIVYIILFLILVFFPNAAIASIRTAFLLSSLSTLALILTSKRVFKKP